MKYITESAANDMMNVIGYTIAAALKHDMQHMSMNELEELRTKIFMNYCENEGITHVEMDDTVEDEDEDEDENDEPRRPFAAFDTETSPMIYNAFFSIERN